MLFSSENVFALAEAFEVLEEGDEEISFSSEGKGDWFYILRDLGSVRDLGVVQVRVVQVWQVYNFLSKSAKSNRVW